MYMNLLLGLLIFTGALMLTKAVPSLSLGLVTRSSYGQVCNKTQRCDSRAWLGCYNGICDCIKQEEMIYESTVNKCVSKSGERCTFALDDDEETNNYIFDVAGCVPHARCSLEGTCLCDLEFYENLNATCTLTHDHQEPCESEDQCSKILGLHCLDGRCQCSMNTSIYSQAYGHYPQCVGLAGQSCVNGYCTHFASCRNMTHCECDPDHFADSDGNCLPKIKLFGNCTDSLQCEKIPGQNLVCLNGQCNCDPELSVYGTVQGSRKFSDANGWGWERNAQFYSYDGVDRSQCVGLVGMPCIDKRCTHHAFCSYSTSRDISNDKGTCKCQSDYVKKRSNTCATGYDSGCSSSSTCADDLLCVNSKCLCPFESQTIDPSTNTCQSKIGGPCNDSLSCEEKAECKISNDGEGAGHCACKSGYVENMEGRCEAGHGTDCLFASDCDSLAALQCMDKKCKCRKFSEFNSTVRKCVGLVGAKCDEWAKNDCIENSHCSQGNGTHPKLPGRCACNPGFQESRAYRCVAVASELIGHEL